MSYTALREGGRRGVRRKEKLMMRMERSMGVGRVEEVEKEGNEIGKWRREGGKDRKRKE